MHTFFSKMDTFFQKMTPEKFLSREDGKDSYLTSSACGLPAFTLGRDDQDDRKVRQISMLMR